MTLYTQVNMQRLYPNVAEVERYAFDYAVSKIGTPDLYVYLTELLALYLLHGFPNAETRIRIWAAAWNLTPANITVGGDLVVRWFVGVPSIINIQNAYLLGQLALCMPYGIFVNWRDRAVTVPPPC